MPCICTYMHLNLAYMQPMCGISIIIYGHAVYMLYICADKLHIVFIYAHISSYRFFPCGLLAYDNFKVIKMDGNPHSLAIR